MTFKKMTESLFLAAALTLSFTAVSHAEETTGEKIKDMGREVKKDTKQTWRNAKNEMCSWVKGKVECAKDTAVNKVKNAADEVKAGAEKTKDKVD